MKLAMIPKPFKTLFFTKTSLTSERLRKSQWIFCHPLGQSVSHFSIHHAVNEVSVTMRVDVRNGVFVELFHLRFDLVFLGLGHRFP